MPLVNGHEATGTPPILPFHTPVFPGDAVTCVNGTSLGARRGRTIGRVRETTFYRAFAVLPDLENWFGFFNQIGVMPTVAEGVK
ncbi:hypothetical protein [Amycolatopsis sp. 195334CR]|uniref:hypothetical protein n=1 Tax=Amycolatopsis sp. 195334CR TaxID=2814588 RepID=UPI001A8BF889|nr:hypothetical protein [Amycolatopsis sp. 195334CR]MBN6040411.1 hypothetical protein [Amycolatopsis sp. 195334CR]